MSHRKDKTPPAVELSRYDQLGPLARAVLADSPLDIETLDMLTAFRNSREFPDDDESLWGAPMSHPEIDVRLASWLSARIDQRIGRPWRPPVARRVRHGRRALF